MPDPEPDWPITTLRLHEGTVLQRGWAQVSDLDTHEPLERLFVIASGPGWARVRRQFV